MRDVTIHRGTPHENFTVLRNEIFDHEELSMEALGLLTFLISRPRDWKVNQAHLKKRFGLGRDKFQRIMRELIKAGYVERRQGRSEDESTFGTVQYHVFDTPIKDRETLDSQQPENPVADENKPEPDGNEEETGGCVDQQPENLVTRSSGDLKTRTLTNKDNITNKTTLTRLAGGVDAALADLSFADLMKLDPLDRAEVMRQTDLKPEDFGKTPREMGINPRALGTNQRASGDNPRAAGTNPRSHPAILADGDWEKLCEGWTLALGDSFERARRPWARLSMADQGLALKHAKAFQQDKPKAHLTTYIRQKRWQSYEQAALKRQAAQFVFIEKGSPEWFAWCNHKRSAIFSSFNTEHRKEGCYQRSRWPPGCEADTKQTG